ncbi:hypothetical protein A3K86_09530 [Photobacterium jeanii]|uniref:Entericidin n=1 Tax=Photobacterium jeanii TaxID=858640 RepID=A0A178KH74_9GAMM|nr:hypothetical protein [Photobacterium jeanii]OAN16679.1 hypothetical protein A3K86_09530 [Photobacterium jeanii]PST87408.1 hypothetical protein C9I91_19200 [Photobacterium jeanii]
MKKTILTAIALSSLVLMGCSAQEKQDLKDGFRDIGHATRDATRATGHFFRDTTKDAIENAKEATSKDESKS